MNASVPALPREAEVQSKIDKIRAFSRSARTVCAALFWFGLAGSAALLLTMLLVALFGLAPRLISVDGGAYDLLMSALTPLPLKLLWLAAQCAVIGVWLAAVHQLRRLFGNLATGAIYTLENVRRVRAIGLLWLLSAVLGIALPVVLAVATRLFGASVAVDFDAIFPSFGETLTSFIAAGVVLLASWIMDVGLYEKQHADALRRDADLVI